MHISILTFDGFNELDSLVAHSLLNFGKRDGWRISIASPDKQVVSMNGLSVEAEASLQEANDADVVLIGSGMRTREIVENVKIMEQIKLDPTRQLIGSQCSGALMLAKLGLLDSVPACTDLTTKPAVIEAGVTVLDQAFYAEGNLATAGGCLSSQYLVGWVMARLLGMEAAKAITHYVAPVGEKETYVERMVKNLSPYLN